MGNERARTIRREIMDLLETGPMTLRDISQAVGIMEKEVCHHLPYIEKTLRRLKKKIRITPYACLNCGFEFRHRKAFKKPGRCPECKEGRIAPAEFRIETPQKK